MKKLLLLVAVALLSAPAFAAKKAKEPGKFKNGVLTNAKGMTLYTFDNDHDDKSECNGPCAKNWPPLKAAKKSKSMGDWTIITRDDGSKQWAYKGKPVYLWKMDKKAGDMTGDNVKNVWHVVKEEAPAAAPANK